MRRTLEQLNLLDDFLIFTMVNHPEFGEKFSRELLKIILGRKFGKLKIFPQKVYYGSDTQNHGARLDVYLEEEESLDGILENATICDLEPEQNDKKKNIKSLPKRVRFYHSKIDSGSLKSGTDYQSLKNVIVIMIMPFDPFGYDHMIYTIQNSCVEVPDMPYDDGAKTLFFYTKGTKGNPAKELKELLYYMEETTLENAKNDTLQEIHKMVESVKKEGQVSLEFMRIMKSREELREEFKDELLEEIREEERARIDEIERRAKAEIEAEKQRADTAEAENEKLRQELLSIKSKR